MPMAVMVAVGVPRPVTRIEGTAPEAVLLADSSTVMLAKPPACSVRPSLAFASVMVSTVPDSVKVAGLRRDSSASRRGKQWRGRRRCPCGHGKALFIAARNRPARGRMGWNMIGSPVTRYELGRQRYKCKEGPAVHRGGS